jgi:hypothetical protein
MHPQHTLGLVRRHASTPLMKQACVNEAPGYVVAQCSSSSLHSAVAASVTAPKKRRGNSACQGSRVRTSASVAQRGGARAGPAWRTTTRLPKPTVPPPLHSSTEPRKSKKKVCISRESNTGLAEVALGFGSNLRMATANFTTKPLKRCRRA